MTETRVSATKPSAAGSRGVTFAGVLKSEWIKLTSLMSTRILLVLTFVAVVGIGVLAGVIRLQFIESMISSAQAQGSQPDAEMINGAFPPGTGFDLYNLPNAGVQLGVLVLGSLAVMFISSEYTTGMIRSTMNAVPKRLPTFAAKAVVLVVVSYVITTLAAVLTFLLVKPMFAAVPVNLEWSTDGVIYSIFTGGLYVAGVALIGLSLGTLLRSSAGGITVLVALFFVVDIAAAFLLYVPGEFWKYVPQYIPSQAGGRFLAIDHVDGMLDPGIAGLLFLAWVLLFLIPATIMLKKRDV